MSLFSRTAAEAEALFAALEKHESQRDSLPVTDRKTSFDQLESALAKLTPVVDKFVTKANLGEADPNKRLYGAAMVTKIRALSSRLADISARVEKEREALNPLYDAHVQAEQKAKAEAESLEKEREQAEAARKAEEERKAMEEEAKRKQEEQQRKAEAEAREKEQIEQRRQAALTLAKLAEEKRKAEEAAAAEKKAREAAEIEAKAKEQAEREAAERKAAEERSKGAITVTVKTAKSSTFTLKDVSPACTVAELKGLIASQHNVPIEAQRLIFQGRLLADAKTIDTYKIINGSAVHLVENYRNVPGSSASGKPVEKQAPKPIVPPGTVCHLKDGSTEFTAILNNCGSHRLVVVDWFAPWCGPCKMISPVFERLAKRFSEVTFVKVDTEMSPANAELAQSRQITAYPTFHFYINGDNAHSFSGANATKIEAGIKKYHAMVGADAAAAAGSAAGSSSAGSSSLTQRVLRALTNLKNNCPVPEFVVAVRTLLTFVSNVVDKPGVEKYRKVRTRNNVFQTKLASKTGGMECMHAFGFESRQENGEPVLYLPMEAAVNPELATVRRQLEQALEAVGSTPQSTQQPRSTPSTTTGNANAGGGVPGAGVPGTDAFDGIPGLTQLNPSILRQVTTDPGFLQLAREMVADPSVHRALLESHTAIRNGDYASLHRLLQDPSLMRFMRHFSNNPILLDAMRRQGTIPPSLMDPPTPGTGNTQGDQTGAQTGQQEQAPNAAPPNFPPTFPGAPATAEEEDRLLQEAIRLSMQDSQANQQKPQEPKKEDDPGNSES